MVAPNRLLKDSLLGMTTNDCTAYNTRVQSPSFGMDSEFWGEINLGDSWQLIPAFEFLPWNKGKYISLSSFPEIRSFGGSDSKIGNDGILAEIAPRWDYCRQTFLSNVVSSMVGVAWQLRNWLATHYDITPKYGKNYRLSVVPVTKEFDLEWLQTLPEEYRILGCAPSLNAFGDEYRIAPEEFCDEVTTRTLGTHIHLGANMSNKTDFYGKTRASHVVMFEYPDMFITLLELFVNIPLTWYWKNYSDELRERRKTYGEAGCYRQTRYGIEWRALPSLVVSSPWLYHAIYGMVRNVFYFAQEIVTHEDFSLLERIWDTAGIDTVRDIINNSDWKAAKDFVTYFEDDYWKVHHYIAPARSGPGNNIGMWKIFKFLADHPEVRRGKDFNIAWKLASVLDVFEQSEQWLEGGYEFSTYLKYSYWGRLSESGPRSEFNPETPEAYEESVEFLTSLGLDYPTNIWKHKKCGMRIPNNSATVLAGTLRRLEPPEDYKTFSIRYCPGCNTSTRDEEWVVEPPATQWVF